MEKIEDRINSLEQILDEERTLNNKYPSRWLSIKLLEGDEKVHSMLSSLNIRLEIDKFLSELDPS